MKRLFLIVQSALLTSCLQGSGESFDLQAWVDRHERQAKTPVVGFQSVEISTHLEEPVEPSRLSRAALREAMLEDVDAAWQRPRVFSRSVEALSNEPDRAALDHLRTIRIPRVEFLRMPLSAVVDQLSALTEQFDPRGQGINIVLLDPGGLDPVVHLTLRGLSLDRILDLVVESVGFEYHATADAVLVRLSESVGRGLETEFFPLNRSTIIRLTGMRQEVIPDPHVPDPFAPVSESETESGLRDLEDALVRFFQRAGIPFASVEGASLALADGQLIVTHTPRNLERMANILRRYSEIKQVEIEARFLEVEMEQLEEKGLEWRLRTAGIPIFDSSGMPVIDSAGNQLREQRLQLGNAPVQRIAPGSGYSRSENRIVIDRPGSSIPDLRVGPPHLPTRTGGNDPGGEFARFSGVMGTSEVEAFIRALERESGSDLLSAPKVTVLSGKTAEITVAQEFRYPQSYGDIVADVGRGDSTSGSAGVAIATGTPRDFTVRNIGVEMRVTPTVEDNNAISLRLEPAVTEFEGFLEYGGPSVAIASDTTVTVPSGFYQPLFSVRRVRTEVTIWDGATVVLGGLTREQTVTVEDRVPVLGKLPLLGRMFRNEGLSSQKRNLLIFITASLVSPGGSPARQQVDGAEPGSLFQMPDYPSPAGRMPRNEE